MVIKISPVLFGPEVYCFVFSKAESFAEALLRRIGVFPWESEKGPVLNKSEKRKAFQMLISLSRTEEALHSGGAD